MNSRIGRIHKLSGNKTVRNLPGQLLGLRYCAFHPAGTICQYQLGTVGFQNISSLSTHGFRHRQDKPVTFDRCYSCKSDTRIAGCWFDNYRAFLQNTFLLCIFNHSFRRTVFDAAGRIQIFQLRRNSRPGLKHTFYIYKFHQRCLADQFKGSSVDLRHVLPILSSYFLYCYNAPKPRSKSAIISSICSVPMERRIVPGRIFWSSNSSFVSWA